MIFSVGHSMRPLEEFLDILRRNEIRRLADVRRFPASRRHPHFNRDALNLALEKSGVIYHHFEELGGRRSRAETSPHTALTVAAFQGYADHMGTPAYGRTLRQLMDWARGERTALMCAEASPEECHRRMLSDALLAHGFRVVHLLSSGERKDHPLNPVARIEGTRVIYDGGVLPLDFPGAE